MVLRTIPNHPGRGSTQSTGNAQVLRLSAPRDNPAHHSHALRTPIGENAISDVSEVSKANPLIFKEPSDVGDELC